MRILKASDQGASKTSALASLVIDPLRILKGDKASVLVNGVAASLVIDPLRILKACCQATVNRVMQSFIGHRSVEDTESDAYPPFTARANPASLVIDPLRILKVTNL